MKSFYVNEKFKLFVDELRITDENNTVRYYVKEHFRFFGQEYVIYDHNDNIVCSFKRKILTFIFKRYYLYMNNDMVAVIQERLRLFGQKYDISSNKGDFTVDGDFFAWNFGIYKDGNLVCKIHKNFTLFFDKYQIEISDDINEAFIIGLAMIMHASHHDNENSSNNNN